MIKLHLRSELEDRAITLEKGGSWRIGRSVACEIVVADLYVSSTHALMTIENGTLVLRHIGGRNPVLMNGEQVKQAALSGNAAFIIGRTQFTVAFDPEDLRRASQHERQGASSTAALPAVPPVSAAVKARVEQTRQLALAKDRGELVRGVLDVICLRLNAKRAFLADLDGEKLVIAGSRGFGADVKAETWLSASVLQQVLKDHSTVLSETYRGRTNAIGTALRRRQVRAFVCAPVLNSEGKAEAVIYVDDPDRTSDFTYADGEFLNWNGQFFWLLSEKLRACRSLESSVVELKCVAQGGAEIVANSPLMISLMERARKAADGSAPVLLLGETGSGKECIARFIHRRSARSIYPFIARNCASIPEAAQDAEMFGCADSRGAFVEAEGGTLFLDEIGELSATMQAKIAHALEHHVIRPVGSNTDLPIHVRLITATHRELADEVKHKRFRESLFQRLSDVTLRIPSLRERRDDILPLALYFINVASDMPRHLSKSAEEALRNYTWPENVRQLRKVIEQCCILSDRYEITADDLYLAATKRNDVVLMSLSEIDQMHILNVLRNVRGNRHEAAKVLGISVEELDERRTQYKESQQQPVNPATTPTQLYTH